LFTKAQSFGGFKGGLATSRSDGFAKRDFQPLLREQPTIGREVLEALAARLAPETLPRH
jgi:hypothetical protein